MTLEPIPSQSGAPEHLQHVSVCVCTFRRAPLLDRLLEDLEAQETRGLFAFSIVVTDNDREQSARAVVEAFAARSRLPVSYAVEPRQNIARARNTAVRGAGGDFVAFIDDDEFPTRDWLRLLFVSCDQLGVAGVLGPVLPHFGAEAPRWTIESGLHDRPRHPTGTLLTWSQTRTGNTLLKRALFADGDTWFNPKCLEGSDQEFFRRMIDLGHSFAWCDEAVVYEVVPPARWTRGFLLRRAVFRGVFSVRNHEIRLAPLLTSVFAVPAYAAVVPLGLVLGQAWFMRYLFRLCYHFGRLIALVGINPIRKPYVTE